MFFTFTLFFFLQSYPRISRLFSKENTMDEVQIEGRGRETAELKYKNSSFEPVQIMYEKSGREFLDNGLVR